MLGLRLREGVDIGEAMRDAKPKLRDRLLSKMTKAVCPYVDQGIAHMDGTRLRLTDPEGFVVSNDVIASLFAAFEEGCLSHGATTS